MTDVSAKIINKSTNTDKSTPCKITNDYLANFTVRKFKPMEQHDA